ncbi:DNA-3-methyladenine glycosylase [Saltatorellus ferox]|uniref:DNA-3-methyladenine glycosylase n=1 Tax=Saltatorellus ferox TaxID=2528018 RepID=UPI003AF3F921
MEESPIDRLGRSEFRRGPEQVARRLLGQRLVRIQGGQRVAGIIVETEAYLGYEDRAAHTFGWRRTERTSTMFMDGGTAYIYLNYGIHHLLNVVVGEVEVPQAVLIRAVEPTEGLETMRARRPRAKRDRDLCSGPGKVGAAFAVTRDQDALDLVTSEELFIERLRVRALPARDIVVCPRIGVDYAGEWAKKPLRYYVKGNPNVSVRDRAAEQP